MLRVTVDSNIYISALNFGGVPDRVVDLARNGQIRVAISDAILDEVSSVLRRKFGWVEDAIAMACEQISGLATRVEPQGRLEVVHEDPTDNRIVECAVADASEFIVTGDRHLLTLGQFKAIRIVAPADFMEIFTTTSGAN